jgi:tonB-dependent receptor domain protein
VQTTKLEGIEVNSVGDNISESGIDEGILNKRVAAGPLADKKVIDMPYQVNTISKEVLDNQGVQAFDEAVKYFPSAQLQYRGGGEMGRPQTRGFQGSVVGNVLWDGFYAVSTTAIPMVMFESLQIQNGLAGSLYGGQNPAGFFNYTRKRPIPFSNTVWADYTSRSNFGIGWDTSNKFEHIGYRGVFYKSDGAKQAKKSDYERNLASLGLDFYLTENFTIETNFSYYRHKMLGNPGGFSMPGANGVLKFDIPSATKTTKAVLEQEWAGSDLKTTTTSAKFKYAPTENWYFEGGYQWQKAIRDMYGTSKTFTNQNGDFEVKAGGGGGAASRFDVQSWFAKAITEFETFGLEHNFGIQANGYIWTRYGARNSASRSVTLGNSNLYSPCVFAQPNTKKASGAYKSAEDIMKNITIADDIKINDYFSVILSAARSNFESKNKQTGVKSYDKSGNSYAGSLIYRPVENVSLYFTYTDSLQTGSAYTYTDVSNPRYGETVVVKPYRSKQYEVGAKA